MSSTAIASVTPLPSEVALNDSLGAFEGEPILISMISLTKAGVSLSEAMKVDPADLRIHDEVVVVLRCTVEEIRFKPISKDADALARVHTLKADTATMLDDAEAAGVSDLLAKQAERIQLAKEAEQGIRRLPDEGALGSDHMDGHHEDNPTEGCPVCESEQAADAPSPIGLV